jgi:hypothetical protein
MPIIWEPWLRIPASGTVLLTRTSISRRGSEYSAERGVESSRTEDGEVDLVRGSSSKLLASTLRVLRRSISSLRILGLAARMWAGVTRESLLSNNHLNSSDRSC